MKAKALEYQEQLRTKIQNLLVEYTEGKISREQFQILYERYNNHLSIADNVAMGLSDDGLSVVQGGMPTLAIKEASRGRAVGMGIYHHRSGTLIETLGNFDISPEILSPVLNEFSLMMDEKKLIDNRVLKLQNAGWLLFAANKYTTVITLFKNEPSQVQVQEIERLHRDFEKANSVLLNVDTVDASKLAYPLLVFVQKKLKK